MRAPGSILAVLSAACLVFCAPAVASSPPTLQPYQRIDTQPPCNAFCYPTDGALDGRTAMLPAGPNAIAVYERQADGVFVHRQTLHGQPPPQVMQWTFGERIALSGDTALFRSVALFEDYQERSQLQVFVRRQGEWRLTQELQIPLDAPSDRLVFRSFALDGRRAVVSTLTLRPLDPDGNGYDQTPHVHVFRQGRNGKFRLESELQPEGPQSQYFSDYFGRNVAILNDTIVTYGAEDVGEDPKDTLLIYKRTPWGWRQKQIVRLEQAFVGAFGRMALRPKRLFIGASFTPRPQQNYRGVVYILERRQGVWTLVQELANPGEAEGVSPADRVRFGESVEAFGDTLVVTNTRDPNLYPAHAYRRDSEGHWLEVARLSELGSAATAVGVRRDIAMLLEDPGTGATFATVYRLPEADTSVSLAEETADAMTED